jgi:hypothetical protein
MDDHVRTVIEEANCTEQDPLLVLYGLLRAKIKKKLALVRQDHARSARIEHEKQQAPLSMATLQARSAAALRPVRVTDLLGGQGGLYNGNGDRWEDDDEEDEEMRLVYGPEGPCEGDPGDDVQKERLRLLW